MAYTVIDDPLQYFNTVLYVGNDTPGLAITGVGFKPDFLWVKNRSSGQEHYLADIARGVTKDLASNSTSAEATSSNLTSFDTDGFTIGGSDRLLQGSSNLVAWNWKAGGAGSSNTDGTINTTSTSVNQTAGFSVSTYTGTGSNATVGHGLGTTPNVYIIKRLNGSSTWITYHSALGIGYHLGLNNDTAQNANDATFSNNTAPSSSVVSLGTWGDLNGSGNTYVMYCFADVKGYSKFGAYRGNNSSNGTHVYTGFKPAWLMVKKYSDTNHWIIWDNKRSTKSGANIIDKKLYANLDNAENGADDVSFLSQGFKFHTNTGDWNEAQDYIYMAFADSPFVNSNGVPNNAE